MFKIGEELKFNEYYTKNFVATEGDMKKTLKGEKIFKYLSRILPTTGNFRWHPREAGTLIERKDNITTYSLVTIKDDDVMYGKYVGEIKRKSKRIYNKAGYNPENRNRMSLVDRLNNVSLRTRPSIKSHRVDDVRKLDTIVLISIQKNRIIGVPINNIIRHNRMDNFKFL